MDNADTITYKLKKKKKKKENDSNNSKESLEKEITSIKKSKTISHKKIGEGEEIKFFLMNLLKNQNLIHHLFKRKEPTI